MSPGRTGRAASASGGSGSSSAGRGASRSSGRGASASGGGASRSGRASSRSRRAGSTTTQARKILFFVVGMAAALVMLAALTGERGYRDVRRQRAKLSRLRAEVDSLHRENASLLQEVRALRTDPFVIEQIAREKLGYAQPGEIVFEFPPEHPPVQDVPPPDPGPELPKPDPR